jgi:DNA-binding phage protein
MINVLRVLGFHLTVQAHRQRAISPATRRPRDVRALYKRDADAKATARLLTVAFKGRELQPIVKALAETLYAKENIAQVARKTIRSRESLYRALRRLAYPDLVPF